MLNGPFIHKSYEDLVGTTLGKYEVIEYLGFGGMATVYKAHHSLLNRDVAIKVLHKGVASESDLVANFVNEARNLAGLHHPNIVQVYDIDITKRVAYIVMEFINGSSLKKDIEEKYEHNSSILIDESILAIQNVGAALSYAHHKNIIHMDVKPSNVLVEKTGRIVLADFGLAKLKKGVTSSLGSIFQGTPAYMSPEQGMGMSGGEQSDIYSLGAVFYEMVTGRQPFESQNPFEVVLKHINDPLPAPSSITENVPTDVESIILKAMEKIPTMRYSSIDLMLADINSAMETKIEERLTATLSLPEDIVADNILSIDAKTSQVSLHFVDTGQIMIISRGKKYILGRESADFSPDIDLSPFSRHEWGISRIHAEIDLGEKVLLKDLDSANGTWYKGKKISSEEAAEMQHGEIFSLGRLKIQILIYE